MTLNLNKTSFFFTTLALLISSYLMLRTYQHGKMDYLRGRNVVYNQGHVLGVDSSQSIVSIDFSKKTAQGSSLIFGGAHYPKLEQTSAWNQIETAGVTSLRSDFYIDRYIPSNITLEDYKNNVKNVQDPNKWNQTQIKLTQNVYKEAQNRNMKTIGIVSYATGWLSHSGSIFGVPKDWLVYEDIVRKSYALYRDNLDYLEVWNEPDLAFFLDTKNSGMTTEEAYHKIAIHAVNAIRQVDNEKNDGKKMKIGIGVISQPTHSKMLDTLFADKNLMKQVDFISYHNYENQPEPSTRMIQKEMDAYQISNIPIFLTEWAHTPEIKTQDPLVLSNLAISYAGSKFIDFLNMGLEGANYFALQQIDPNSKRGDEGYLGFFVVKDGKNTMLPIVKTWTLMSKTLGLGGGTSTIFESNHDQNTKIAAWKNEKGEHGIVMSNSSNSVITYNATVFNYPNSGQVLASAYLASGEQDGAEKLGSIVVENKNNQMAFKIVSPPNSVIGVKFGNPSLVDRVPLLP